LGKLTPSSLFYLPCQAQNSADSFFIDHNSSSRLPLDPYVWAGYAANHHRPAPEPSEAVTETVAPTVAEPMPTTDCPMLHRIREMIAAEGAGKVQDRAQRQAAAIDQWHGTPAKGGNRAFFQLGVDLRGAGMSMADIDATLRQEAHHARHPAERRSQVKYIMRTLRGSFRRPTA
jgi:hypothetical protein